MIQDAPIAPESIETLKKQAVHLASVCRRAIKRTQSRLEKQEAEKREAIQFPHFSQLADSLVAHPASFHRGQTTVTIENIHTQETETMTLDPSLTVFENAQELYKKARKGKRGLEIIEANIKDSRAEEIFFQGLLKEIQDFADTDSGKLTLDEAVFALECIGAKMQDAGMVPRQGPKQKEKAQKSVPYRHITLDGYDVYIGKNDAQNDELSTRFCKPWDIWMHVAGHAGSHVVIRRDKNAQWPPKDLLLKVASFAIWFSKAKHTSYAEVNVTEGRFVRKRRRAPPGEVIAERCKTLRTSPQNPQEYFAELVPI